jgi:membrane-associated phospholipid phosphatase
MRDVHDINILEYLGFQGPILTLVITAVALLKRSTYLALFLVCYFVQYGIVVLLKQIIRQPRPSGYQDSRNHDTGYYQGLEQYGMPSGHSSGVWYCTVFLWLAKGSPYITMVELGICALTMYQRVAFHKHTTEQVLAGALVGSAVAWVVINMIPWLRRLG